jgi:hypothetical protein
MSGWSSPCGPGHATGATEQGVTNSTINIAYGDDRGFSGSPGLDQEMGDAVKAMIAWCDAQGGSNGRKIVGDYYDAAVTNVGSVMTQACKTDFMLVGEGFALDGLAEQTRWNCDLAAVPGFTVSADVANAYEVRREELGIRHRHHPQRAGLRHPVRHVHGHEAPGLSGTARLTLGVQRGPDDGADLLDLQQEPIVPGDGLDDRDRRPTRQEPRNLLLLRQRVQAVRRDAGHGHVGLHRAERLAETAPAPAHVVVIHRLAQDHV